MSLQIDDPEAFAQRLRQTRQAQGMTLKQLSFEGCGEVFLSRVENGHRRPSVWVAYGLAERLGVTAHWLITGKEDPLVETARKVVAEHRSGVEIPKRLIDKLDRLSR